MKRLLLLLSLNLFGVFTYTPAFAASFSGDFDVRLQISLSQLIFFNFENDADSTQSSDSDFTGTGIITQLVEPTSTQWELDGSLSFLELNYEGSEIGGQSGSDGFASATVSGTSQSLKITNTTGQAQTLIITGIYSANLMTALGSSTQESASLNLNFNLVTDSGQELGEVSQSLSETDSFSVTDEMFEISELTIESGESQIVFLESDLSGSASADDNREIPESSTILGTAIALGVGVCSNKRSRNYQDK